ncbi:MAG: TraR/DksA family transcriptional regulator [Luteolibacter sp.]|jgi:DnaK suppressor protein|nr:TraR/DksA family transcriptional regulator [Luteolibacter sp.]
MNATQLAEIRGRLLEERERIITEWKNHGGDGGPTGDWDLRDPEERAVQITSDTVERQIAEDDLNLLRKVDLALRRLAENTYESCERCGATIPMERLMAKPSASLCLACQEAKDAAPD